MDNYELTYKDVLCRKVDWSTETFVFVYKGFTFKYVQKYPVKTSADTDHIRCVISEFLKTISDVEDIIFQTLNFVDKRIEKLEDLSYNEEDDENRNYYSGQLTAYLQLKSYITDELVNYRDLPEAEVTASYSVPVLCTGDIRV